MKLEQQVVSLELAKKLKELGVKQESLYWWTSADNKTPILRGWMNDYETNSRWTVYSAFTVAELGEMLPTNIEDYYIIYDRLVDSSFHVYYEKIGKRPEILIKDQGADTEADARAKMIIYLLENKLI